MNVPDLWEIVRNTNTLPRAQTKGLGFLGLHFIPNFHFQKGHFRLKFELF